MNKREIYKKHPTIRKIGCRVHNFVNHIRIKLWAKHYKIHEGTKQIFIGGLWEDKYGNLYNCLGQRIGTITREKRG